MADAERVDQSLKPPNPDRSNVTNSLLSLVGYSFCSDTSTIGHIEFPKGKGDKVLINFEGKEVRVHFPSES